MGAPPGGWRPVSRTLAKEYGAQPNAIAHWARACQRRPLPGARSERDEPRWPKTPADQTAICFRVRERDGNLRTLTQCIPLERIPRHFGGTQTYFRCWSGDRRAVRRYSRRGFYLCRRCHHLAYECEREDACERTFCRFGKIKQRLGGNSDCLAPFQPKPKGMWRRTYQHFGYQFREAGGRAEAAFQAAGSNHHALKLLNYKSRHPAGGRR